MSDRNARVPVLLHHSVRAEPTPGYEAWETSPTGLRRQLDQLDAAGFTPVPLPAYARWLRGATGASLPERAVVITFDDGFANFLDVAPLFVERAWPVTMFVPTAYVGGESDWLPPEFRRSMLTWSQILDLDRSGIEIGAHAHRHRPIDTLRPRELHDELTRSRDLLQERLGHACTSFAYPHGYNSRRVRAAVADASFAQACAVQDAMSGAGDDPLAIARLFVGWSDVGERFDRLLVSGHRRRARHERMRTRGWRVYRRTRSRLVRHGEP